MFFERLVSARLAGPVSRNKVRLLFGARQVGKTALLAHVLPSNRSVMFNLQDSGLRRRCEQDPASFYREVRALPERVTHVGVDEVQKVPALLDELQRLVDEAPGRFQFFVTGSSARRLRVGAANLLPGRAHVFALHPVIRPEEVDFVGPAVGPRWPVDLRGFPSRSLASRLLYGSLPGVRSEGPDTAAATLEAYVDLYLEEEIRREALVRDMGAFAAFLRLAAIDSGGQVNLAGLSRESGVPASTLKNFYQVLVDTFVGHWVLPCRKTARRRLLTTPRFLFFDLGVRNAAAGVPMEPGLLAESGGPLLEQWVGTELIHRAAYAGRGHSVSFWRTAAGAEVDFVYESPSEVVPVEVKWTERPHPADARHVETFLDLHGGRARRGLVVCRAPGRQALTDRTTAIPWFEL